MGKNSVGLGIAALVAVGCGGGGSSSTTTPTALGVTGQTTLVTTQSVATTAVSTVPGKETPTTLVVNGANEVVAVPGGETIPSGANVYLIPKSLPIQLSSTTKAAITQKGARQTTLTRGEFYFQNSDGTTTDTGLHLSNYALVGSTNTGYEHFAFAFPTSGSSRNITLFVAGPVNIGSGSSVLTVSDRVSLTFELSNAGNLGAGRLTTYPEQSTYALPANGNSTYLAKFQIVYDKLAKGNSVPATMTVAWPGHVKTQTRNTAGGTVTLYDGVSDSVTDVVPSAGITSATLKIAN